MIQQKMQFCSISFNPRSYKRSDYFQRYMQKTLERFQSTLLQEERQHSRWRFSFNICFQSTLLQEERHTNLKEGNTNGHFQSTLLQEERQEIVADFLSLYAFNPRSYKRSDMLRYHKILIHFHFQSTLLQEERPYSIVAEQSHTRLSIHAPTRGATKER